MLKSKAEIMFTLHGKNYTAHDKFHVAFNFGNDLLFGARISGDTKKYFHNQTYLVDLEFFTVCSEAYKVLQPLLSTGMDLTMQAGRQLLGVATLLEYEFIESDQKPC